MRSEVDFHAFSIAKDQPGRENQDYYDYLPESGLPAPEWTDFAAIAADGVGSSAGPSEAAAAAAQTWLLHVRAKFIENGVKCASFDDVHFDEIVSHAFAQAHEAVLRKTTGSACAAAVCLQGDRLLIGNVGDCRIYRIRGIRMEQLSEDQVDQGGDPTQVVGGKRIPQAYASSGNRVKAGDVVILCTDGVWKLLAPADIQLAATGASAKEIAASLQRSVMSKRKLGSDDATALVALVKRVGRPFWADDETDSESGDDQLKDNLDVKIDSVLAELLNRIRGPLDRQNALAERALNDLGSAVDQLRSEIDALRAETGGARRNRKQSGSEWRSAYTDVSLSVLMILGGVFLGWILRGPVNTPPTHRLALELPPNTRVISQKYENDRLLVKVAGKDGKQKLAVYRLEDGGKPFAIIDMSTDRKSDVSVP